MTNSDILQHTSPIFKTMSIIQLSNLSTLYIASYMFKQIKSSSTHTLLHSHNVSTCNQHPHQIPQHSLTLYQHSVMFKGPKIWNSIPRNIKQSANLDTFKRNFRVSIIILLTHHLYRFIFSSSNHASLLQLFMSSRFTYHL